MLWAGVAKRAGRAAVWFAMIWLAPVFIAERDAVGAERVDLELILAVDVSRSMDFGEQIIQRKGYAEAFRSPEVIDAILGGGLGRIAVLYLEWAGDMIQDVVVPWTLIDSSGAALAFADRLERREPQRLSRTSISGAMLAADTLFGTSDWSGVRRVVDISGDGPNNQGVAVEDARDRLIASGATINGLPLLVRPTSYGFGIDNLDDYYIDCVIGGPGAFSLPVRDWVEFPAAVRRKLVLEIAGFNPHPAAESAGLLLAQTSGPARGGSDCLIGERLWEMRMRDLEIR